MRRPILALLLLVPTVAPAQIARGVGSSVDQTAGTPAATPPPVTVMPVHGRVIRVQAGARILADRRTRCYDGSVYYDPWYQPDGHYYCAPRGPNLAAGQPG